ncbi:MAG: hypothetical protein ACLT3D_03380 [Lawsonibacter sp.]
MKGIRKMDEMELQITLRASRAAWFFLVLALVVWSVWEAFLTEGTLPCPLSCWGFRQ